MATLLAPFHARSILIDEVDELTQPTVVAASKAECQAGEIPYFGFVVLIGMCADERKSSGAADIAEFLVDTNQSGFG